MVAVLVVVTSLSAGMSRAADPNLPADFPKFTVTALDANAVGDGYIFLNVTETSPSVGYYAMILRNDGTPVWYQRTSDAAADFKLLSNGLLHNGESYHTLSWTGGGTVYHRILDNDHTLRETISMGNGYLPEAHDIDVLPNGNVLEMGYYQSYMDLSRIATGAWPNALVAGAVIQELDAQRNVVWQWRSWDYYDFKTYYAPLLMLNQMASVRNPVVDSFHLNAVSMDTDGNILMSNFMVDVQKINRQTGEVMWRLGGFGNQFSFVGEDPRQAAAHFSCHGLTRLANGNVLLLCNADQLATRSSKVYEYTLDEVNKVATLVWSYTPATPWYSWHAGNARRLSNGNTFIGWGGGLIWPGVGGVANHQVPACTEVTASGRVVFEMMFDDPLVASYRAFRVPYPQQAQAVVVPRMELALGNTYDFGATGVSLTVTSGGGGYNAVVVAREPYAPLYPLFPGKAPRVATTRVSMVGANLKALEADIEFDAAALGLANPGNLTVYYRLVTGRGLFVPQRTYYNPATGRLIASMVLPSPEADLGEFCFGCPDVAEVPYPPILNAVENYRGVQPDEVIAPLRATVGVVDSVNQTLPVSLSWSPKGFASSYQIQVATNPEFSGLIADKSDMTDAFHVMESLSPNTTYFYRVRTWNDGGVSDWSTGSFQTAAPFLQVTTPNGGESLKKGIATFIQWKDNISENVVIELYKAGTLVKAIATYPSTGGYKWVVGLDLEPGSDYSIKIKSSTNEALADASDTAFSIQ
jgi:hypothetical protein